jgi:hypothetical protein
MQKILITMKKMFMARKKFLVGLVMPSRFEKNPIWISNSPSPFKNPTQLTANIYKEFQLSGTDKSSNHTYHFPYSFILGRIGKSKSILEIGIGSTSSEIPFNMEWKKGYKPGSSLSAWRNLGFSKVVGADIDQKIIDTCEDFECFYVDQTKRESLLELRRKLNERGLSPLDMIVDDGIHQVEYNLMTFEVLSQNLKSGGIYVIEDLRQSDVKSIMLRLEHFRLADWHLWINPTEGENCAMLIIEMNNH